MKYSDFEIGDTVVLIMPKGSGQREVEGTVLDKGADGVVLIKRSDGKRFFTNSHRIKQVKRVED